MYKNTFVDGWELLTMANLHISKNISPNITFYSYYPLQIDTDIHNSYMYDTVNFYELNEFNNINEYEFSKNDSNEYDSNEYDSNDSNKNDCNEYYSNKNELNYNSCESESEYSDDSEWTDV